MASWGSTALTEQALRLNSEPEGPAQVRIGGGRGSKRALVHTDWDVGARARPSSLPAPTSLGPFPRVHHAARHARRSPSAEASERARRCCLAGSDLATEAIERLAAGVAIPHRFSR
jgi:hypothetical protein